MNADLHNTDSNSVTINNFKEVKGDIFSHNFSTVTVKDGERNSVTLYFSNLSEVLNFSLMIQQEAKKLIKDSVKSI